MVDSAMRHIGILEELDFHDIIVSVKASSIPLAAGSYRLLAEKVNYPLHLNNSLKRCAGHFFLW